MLLYNLLNVLVEIANKMGLQKKNNSFSFYLPYLSLYMQCDKYTGMSPAFSRLYRIFLYLTFAGSGVLAWKGVGVAVCYKVWPTKCLRSFLSVPFFNY
jgi:hypothetical protein